VRTGRFDLPVRNLESEMATSFQGKEQEPEQEQEKEWEKAKPRRGGVNVRFEGRRAETNDEAEKCTRGAMHADGAPTTGSISFGAV
jgi:hypothetical protein